MTQERLPWSSAQCDRAAQMYKRLITDIYSDDHGVPSRIPRGSRDKVFFLIAEQIGRTYASVAARWHQYGVTFDSKSHSQKKEINPAEVEAELRRRAAERMDLTQRVFGDPAPGFSALDKKRSGVEA